MKSFFSKLMIGAFTFLFTISVYAVAPSITGVTTIDPATYDDGDTISLSVQFDQIVTVSGGVPDLKFRSPDNLSKSASYVSGSGTDTLVFEYSVTSTINHNDWDGIELENSSGNPANLVMNGATIQNAGLENAIVTVPVTNFAGIKIDSKPPTWDRIEISSTAGFVSGNIRHLPVGTSILTKSFLTENDTRLSASVGLSVAGGVAQIINYTGSNINGHDKDAQKTGTLTGEGVISLSSQSWIDQANKIATGIPTFIVKDANLAVDTYIINSAAPNFAGISVTSNNFYDNSYGKTDSILTFTLTLTSPDSYDGNGDITFTINGTPQTIPFVNPANSAPAGTYTATFDLSTFGTLVDNAAISITGVNFADFLGQPITNFAAGAPTPTVIVDTKSPTINSASASTNGAGGTLAKAGDIVTFSLGFDEDIIRGILNSASTANNISSLTKEFNISTFGTSDNIQFTAQTGDNGIVTINNADFTIIDRAGNSATISAGDINALVTEIITTDTTGPTISNISISSNNALDTTLAKTNDTITVQFDTADNISTTVSLINGSILSSAVTDGVTGAVGAAKNIARFTDGTETSEVIVPFVITIADEAGNQTTASATTDSSQVQFDRTDPIVRRVKISATSADGTAFLGDVPTYYAKQGDTLDFELQVCDFVDSQNNAPAGTLFGQAVTLTDDGQTGVACTTPEGNASIWRKWKTQLTGIDGIEGTVLFSIDVNDNAGNVLVNVAGTTNGSSVIFDKTIPLNPTDVMDALGAEILPFKHRSKAQFSWTNDADDTTNSATVSGIQNYNVRFTNPANGTEVHRNERIFPRNFDGRLSTLTPWNGLSIPPRDIVDPYDFHIQTRDKAGNDAPEVIAYTQPYTIGFVGTVTDEQGNPISGALVQVVSRYGETCDLNREVCTGVTDVNGEYTVLAEKDQDYNLTFFHQRYYLDKQEDSMGNQNDTIVNSVLSGVTSVHEVQTTNQGVEVTTSEKFADEYGTIKATKIFVYSWSGEISIDTSVAGQITISSLSRINSIKSNNPDILIRNNGNNTYTVVGVGNVLSTTSITGDAEANSRENISAFGTSAAYSSGNSRIATKYIPSNGSFGNTFGKYKTPAEWAEFGDRLKNGVEPQILTYVNRNGHEVFRGYRYGILGWDRFEKRFQNQVKFRGISRANNLVIDANDAQEKIKEVITLAEKVNVMKDSYQNNYQTMEEKESEFLAELQTLKPLKRVKQSDAYKGILLRKDQKNKVNKFERRNTFGDKIIKNPHAKKVKTMKIKFSNGTSAKIERVMK